MTGRAHSTVGKISVAGTNDDPLLKLFFILRPQLITYFTRRGLSPTDAEDFSQEVFARFVKAQYDASAPDAVPKLFRIARNHWVDHIRASKTRHGGVARPATVFDDKTMTELADLEPLADVQISDRQDLDRVMRAIQALPQRCRLAFELSRFEELSYTQIAARMKTTNSTVEKHIGEALRRITRAFEGPEQ